MEYWHTDISQYEQKLETYIMHGIVHINEQTYLQFCIDPYCMIYLEPCTVDRLADLWHDNSQVHMRLNQCSSSVGKTA